MFTKQEMKTELREFMVGFARGVGRMYGSDRAGALLGHPGVDVASIASKAARLEAAPLWFVLDNMYEFGVRGILNSPSHFGPGQGIDGWEADVELFLMSLNSMEPYFEEDDVLQPRLARRTMRTAIARHVLEGGERYMVNEDAPWDWLSLAEVALLADMDERSVRNAANPKLPNPLVTENVDKRAVVSVAEARRWLANRKGFVATTYTARREPSEQRASIALSTSTADRLVRLAHDAGMSVEQFIVQFLEDKQP